MCACITGTVSWTTIQHCAPRNVQEQYWHTLFTRNQKGFHSVSKRKLTILPDVHVHHWHSAWDIFFRVSENVLPLQAEWRIFFKTLPNMLPLQAPDPQHKCHLCPQVAWIHQRSVKTTHQRNRASLSNCIDYHSGLCQCRLQQPSLQQSRRP